MKQVTAEEECGECIGVPLHYCTNTHSHHSGNRALFRVRQLGEEKNRFFQFKSNTRRVHTNFVFLCLIKPSLKLFPRVFSLFRWFSRIPGEFPDPLCCLFLLTGDGPSARPPRDL